VAAIAASGDVVGCVGKYGGCHGRRGSVRVRVEEKRKRPKKAAKYAAFMYLHFTRADPIITSGYKN
jgi:hypothetical protein